MIEYNFYSDPIAVHNITNYLQCTFDRNKIIKILIRSELYDSLIEPPELGCFDGGCNFTVNAYGIRGFDDQSDLLIFLMPEDEKEFNTNLNKLVESKKPFYTRKEKTIPVPEPKNDLYTYEGMGYALQSKDRLLDLHLELTNKANKLMQKKNSDYAYGNDPYANFRGSEMLGISPVMGILLRMQDKMMRIKTFDLTKNLLVKGESVEDSIIDIINYAVLIAGFIEYETQRGKQGCVNTIREDKDGKQNGL